MSHIDVTSDNNDNDNSNNKIKIKKSPEIYDFREITHFSPRQVNSDTKQTVVNRYNK